MLLGIGQRKNKRSESCITDADLEFIPGKEDELFDRLPKNFKKARK